MRVYRIARGLLILAGVLPLLVPLFEQVVCLRGTGLLLRQLYGWQCHQRASRSFAWGSSILPVCARCLGIYLGVALAAVVGHPRLRKDAFKAWMLIGALLVTLDVATEWVQLRPANAWLRFGVGALLSYGIVLAILASLRPRRG